jgi:hypothetical protein
MKAKELSASELEGHVCGELRFGVLFIFLTCDTMTQAVLAGLLCRYTISEKLHPENENPGLD